MIQLTRSAIVGIALLLFGVTAANAQLYTGGSASDCPSCAAANSTVLGQFTGDKTTCGHFGLNQYPASEQRYIKQFCHPTICPGSCFGVFKTQWNRWEEACPNWHAGNANAIVNHATPLPQNVTTLPMNQQYTNPTPNREVPNSNVPTDPSTRIKPDPTLDTNPKIPPDSSNPLPSPKKVPSNDPRPSIPPGGTAPMPKVQEPTIPNISTDIPTMQPLVIPPIPDIRIKH